MRKLVTLASAGLLVLAAGCHPDDFSLHGILEGEFARTVLLEKGTAVWCGYCPQAAENVAELVDGHPDELIHIDLHCWGNDPYENDETNSRVKALSIDGIPTVIMDGVYTDYSVKDMEARLEELSAKGTPVKINLVCTASVQTGDTTEYTYEIDVICSEAYTGNIEASLRVALVQDSVDYSEGAWDGLHNTVIRLPTAGDDDELYLEPGDSVHLTRMLGYESSDTLFYPPFTAVVWVEDAELKIQQSAAVSLD